MSTDPSVATIEIFSLSEERKLLRKEKGDLASFKRNRSFTKNHPDLLILYFKYRDKKNPMGELFREYEKKHLDFLREISNYQDEVDLLLIRATIHGLILSPFLTDKQAQDCFIRFMEEKIPNAQG